MGRASNYPDELRERAVRMVAEVRPQYPSQWAAITAVAGMLGIGTPETLRSWIRRSEVDVGQRPGVTSQMAEENRALRKETPSCAEPIRSLKQRRFSSGPSSTGPGDGDPVHRRTQGQPGGRPDGGAGLRWGVEPMCAVLSDTGADQPVDLLRVDQ
jgi:transposase